MTHTGNTIRRSGASSEGPFVLCLLTSVLVSGCGDPVRTTAQPVRVEVTSSLSGQPLADAQVSLRYDYDRNVPPGEALSEAERPGYQWFWGTTNARGQTDIPVKWTMLDRSLGCTPPAWRDQVTNKVYLVRVIKDGESEQTSLVIRVGATTASGTFRICVIDVRPPRYVKTPP